MPVVGSLQVRLAAYHAELDSCFGLGMVLPRQGGPGADLRKYNKKFRRVLWQARTCHGGRCRIVLIEADRSTARLRLSPRGSALKSSDGLGALACWLTAVPFKTFIASGQVMTSMRYASRVAVDECSTSTGRTSMCLLCTCG